MVRLFYAQFAERRRYNGIQNIKTLQRRVKLAMDRAALLGLPSFEIRRKQLFHKPRYKKHPFDMLVYASSEHDKVNIKGFEDEVQQAKLISLEERRVFEAMIQRDSEHFDFDKCKVVWLSVFVKV